MRKAIGLNVVLVIAIVFTSGAAFAVNGAPNGPHWNVNFIGHPKEKGIGGDYSSGHSIMIPLKTARGPDKLTCNGDGVNFVDDTSPTPGTLVPGAAKIYFVGGDTFEILDRDAIDDGQATIQLPVDMASTTKDLKFTAYMRVLGKPNKYDPLTGDGTVACMNINGYVFDTFQQLWYETGTVTVSRGKGKSAFVNVTDLFMVWWCTAMDTVVGGTCTETTNTSVFADVFSGYFWEMLNDGTRLVQVRFYPTN